MVKEECLLNVVQYLCSLSLNWLHLCSTSAGLSSSLLFGVRENQSQHQHSLCCLCFITPRPENVQLLVKVGQKAQMRAANIVFLSQAVLVLQCLVEVLCFKRTEKWYKIAEKLETDGVFIIPWFKFWFSFQISVFLWFCTLRRVNLFRQTFSFSNYLHLILISPPLCPWGSVCSMNSKILSISLRIWGPFLALEFGTHILKILSISVCFFCWVCPVIVKKKKWKVSYVLCCSLLPVQLKDRCILRK